MKNDKLDDLAKKTYIELKRYTEHLSDRQQLACYGVWDIYANLYKIGYSELRDAGFTENEALDIQSAALAQMLHTVQTIPRDDKPL